MQRRKQDLVEIRVKIAELVRELNVEAVQNDAVVLVEGKRDVKALREAGYSGPLISVQSSGIGIEKVAEMIEAQHKKVILLVDFDHHGGKLAGRLKRILEYDGLTVDDTYRENLFNIFEGGTREVEGLRRYL